MTEKELYHYGTKRHSGRYPFGSGKRPFQGLVEAYRKAESKIEKNKEDKAMKKEYLDKSRYKRLLTSDELLSQIGRLENEAKLKKLTAENVAPGKVIVDRILMNSGSKVAEKVLTESGIYAISKLVESSGNKELAAMIKKKDKK